MKRRFVMQTGQTLGCERTQKVDRALVQSQNHGKVSRNCKPGNHEANESLVVRSRLAGEASLWSGGLDMAAN
jgi:hypothetical protein